MECVVMEREFDIELTTEMVLAMAKMGAGCETLYGVEPIRSYLSPDGRRMICVFRAPDAEAVRIMARNAGSPPAKVWKGSEHTG
ncbi:MAG: nickel-binding protein [Myxococcota bacterium]